MNSDVSILNYSIGNLYSVEKAFNFIGAKPKLITEYADILNAERLVIPGVGAFGQCMTMLKMKNFVEPILEFLAKGKPLLGICVGMQMLFEASEEDDGVAGLSLIKGKVKRISHHVEGKSVKVPHIGWNDIKQGMGSHLLKGIAAKDQFYFLHSYSAEVQDVAVRSFFTDYQGYPITALVESENIFGCQFHPEKSRSYGLKVLMNFMNI